MSDGSHDDIFPPTPRPPAESPERVTLEFDSFREFIDEYSPHISGEGIFLLGEPRQVGSQVAFEVRLSDDFRLIHGTGKVEWVVEQEAPGQQRGSALRFAGLDEPSRRLVARLVDSHRGTGGVPFDLDRPPPSARAEVAAPAGPESPEGLSLSSAVGRETIAIPIPLAGLSAEPPEPSEAPEPSPPGIEDPPSEPEVPPVREPPSPAPPERQPPTPPGPPREEPPSEKPPIEEPSVPRRYGGRGEVEELETVDAAADEASDFEVGSDALEAPLMELDPLPPSSAGAAVDELSAGLGSEEEGGPGVLRSGDRMAAREPERLSEESGSVGRPVEIPAEESSPEDLFAGLVEPPTPGPPALESDSGGETGPGPSGAAEVPPVEMPDPEDLAEGPYAADSERGRASTFLWLAICALAVVLGAAAWRYRDTLGDRFSALMPGQATVSEEPAAVVAAQPERMGDAAEGSMREDGGAAAGGVGSAVQALDSGAREAAAGAPDPLQVGAESADSTAQGAAFDADDAEGDSPPVPQTSQAVSTPAAGPGAPTLAESGAEGREVPLEGRPSRLERIDFRRRGGNTELRIVADRELGRDAYELIRVASPPRQVVKIFGPDEPYPQERLAVGTSQVRRLRIGFHRNPTGGEIHVVADLAASGVRVLGVDVSGSTLTVTFGQR